MSAHTKGPWTVSSKGGFKYFAIKEYLDSYNSAKPSYETHDEFEANARLIAASPGLLEALKNIVAFSNEFISTYRHDELFNQARQIISKAEGSGDL